MLNRELSHFAESSKSGNQISEYICSTFLGKYTDLFIWLLLRKKATTHQVTNMLATSKNVLFPGHNHLLTTGTDDSTLIIARSPVRVIIKVKGHQYQWLAGGYDWK